MRDAADNPADFLPDIDLEQRRRHIRRGLTRANIAAVVILVIVIGLSLAALIQALRADQNAEAEAEASARGKQQLWRSQLAQAGALRLSGLAGRKAQALAAISSAAAIQPSLELRNEAIATLALTDASSTDRWRPAHIYGNDALALAPDLQTYALGNLQGTVAMFRMSSGEKIAQFQGPAAAVAVTKFSRDGRLLAASFWNGEVMVWKISDGSKVAAWSSSGSVRSFPAFDVNPDASRIAIACGQPQVRILNLDPQNEKSPLTVTVTGAAADVLFAPTGNMLAIAVSNRVELWQWPEPKLMRQLSHAGEVTALAWAPDGRRLASASRGTPDIELWDCVTGRDRRLRGHAELIPHLAFDQQNELLISFSWDGSTRFWQARDGELLFVSRAGFGLDFDTSGTRLAYSREHQGFGLWNVSRSSIFHELTIPLAAVPPVIGFDFSRDGHTMALMNPDGLHVLDVLTGTEQNFLPLENPVSVWFTDETGLVSVTRSAINTWRIPVSERAAWEQKKVLDAPGVAFDFGTTTRGASSLVAVPSQDNVFWFDLNDAAHVHRVNGHGAMGALTGAAISADTNWIATTFWKGGASAVWSTRTGNRVRDLGRNGGYVAFSADNRWLLVGSAHSYAVWDINSWQQRFEFERETTGELVGSGAFSPDGKLMAICPQVDQIQLIALPQGQVLATLTSPLPRNIRSVAFSPDGTTLAASTFDTRLQLWSLPAIRNELAALHLDWTDSQGALSANETASMPPLAAAQKRHTNLGQAAFYWLDGLGVLAAMFIGLYTLRYHQRMMSSYEEVERLVAERNRELKLAQLELLHSQKMKALGTLAAGVAHDFNNLLSVIRMGNQLQAREGISPDDKSESSRAVERAVEQGKKVVRSMLGYSREPGQGRQTFSVPEMVDEVVLLLNKQFLGGLTLTLELNRDTPLVNAVRGRIEQILLNLLVNAAEAMDGEGRLLISVREISELVHTGSLLLRPRPATSYVELMIKDNGPGIEPAVRDRIFEPFFSTKPQSASSGTGLGLSLVHSLAEQEGLGLSLESDQGKGTTFKVVIPVQMNRLAELSARGSLTDQQQLAR